MRNLFIDSVCLLISSVCVVFVLLATATCQAESQPIELSINPAIKPDQADQDTNDAFVSSVQKSIDENPILWTAIGLLTIAILAGNLRNTMTGSNVAKTAVNQKTKGSIITIFGLLICLNVAGIGFGFDLILSNVLFLGGLLCVIGLSIMQKETKKSEWS